MSTKNINENCVLHKDYGSFGDSKWQYHICEVSWFGKEPKFGIRPWNEDMSKYGKGITLEKDDLYDMLGIIEDILDNN